MKAVIMGAGVAGVANAYYLAKEGFQVTVIDRQDAPAQETSFANAGMIAPGHSFTWNSPSAPMKLLRSLFGAKTSLRLKLSGDPRFYAWGLQFLRNCTPARAREKTLVKLSLCQYSQQATKAVAAEAGIDYDHLGNGILYLYRDQANLETGVEHMRMMREQGLRIDVLDAEGCARVEPTLGRVKHRIAGAIHCPDDESGDCEKFTVGLAETCRRMGVEFRYGTTVQGIDVSGGAVGGVVTDKGRVEGDIYVLSLGSYSPLVARNLDVSLPVYPVKGYSLTLPIEGRNAAPSVPTVDEENLVAVTRMGDRMRMTATAEFSGYDNSNRPSDFDHMIAAARDLYPDSCNFAKPQYWSCLRPMTPDGPPVLGRGKQKNMYFNTGHGHMGWTMACGTGRITTDIIMGRKPEIDATGMLVDRFN
ncbi:MAG: D-amino acid dehydrogenase [Alphaproteobacteria bacterium]|nr:D-amino acid dehydrogenase [Alphaproteobacteria bacterium]